MKVNHLRLVLECIVLATEVIRLANKLITLLNMTFNYRSYRDADVGFPV